MGKFKFKLTKKKLIAAIGVVVLLLAALGAGFFVWWWQNKDKIRDNTTPYIKTFEKTLPATVDEAQDLAISGKVAESNQKIQDALKNPDISAVERQKLLIQQGVNYGNKGDHQKALDFYLEAEKIVSDFTSSHLIGEEAEALGKKQMAIDYYKKAVSQLNPESPSYESDKNVYEAKAKELGG